ncbi:hypothetical protein HDV05_003951 [Chytridiales sp. JEL 0842]|nr:hypothetical protein HDV05_003951 [Chytridiales sp. JEL 0842]
MKTSTLISTEEIIVEKVEGDVPILQVNATTSLRIACETTTTPSTLKSLETPTKPNTIETLETPISANTSEEAFATHTTSSTLKALQIVDALETPLPTKILKPLKTPSPSNTLQALCTITHPSQSTLHSTFAHQKFYIRHNVFPLHPTSSLSDKTPLTFQPPHPTPDLQFDFETEPYRFLHGALYPTFDFHLTLPNNKKRYGQLSIHLCETTCEEGRVGRDVVDVSVGRDGSEVVEVRFRVKAGLGEQVWMNPGWKVEGEGKKKGAFVGGVLRWGLGVLGLRGVDEEEEGFREWLMRREVGRFRARVEILEVRVVKWGCLS